MSNKIKYAILFYVGFTTYITIETLFRGYSFCLMGIDGAICFLIFDSTGWNYTKSYTFVNPFITFKRKNAINCNNK